MTLNQKIADVLHQIETQKKLTLASDFIYFEFTFVGGGGIYHTDQKRILLKLEEERVLVLHQVRIRSEEDSIATSSTVEDFMNTNEFIYIELLPKFYFRYLQYLPYKSRKNLWKILNPIYWVILLIQKIVSLAFRFKVISLLLAVITLLAIDFHLVWENLSKIIQVVNAAIFK